ncbi:DUF3617 domain-containing protein [Sphingobium subterraneum]|uniref:DUF3617 domain-containing protein n=1 Tax=Sphingobium subterraneum TaxID=627688 RepID=A0A841J1L5_9SPHN|nr:DUF3617 domain-containing protein [Sphingobium subterraneum]MBB6124833.1 hypothetical protein [Sphingobium subterraneum]
MMSRRHARGTTLLLSAAALLALGACGKADDAGKVGAPSGNEAAAGSTNMSVAQVAGEMNKVKLQPGQWEMTHEITDVQITNAPEGMPAGAMQSMVGKKTVVKECITPQQAENPAAEMMAGQKDNKCKYANFSMSGGKVSGQMSCSGGQDGSATMNMTLNGTYSSTSYDMNAEMRTSGMMGAAKDMQMAMKSHGTGKRIGECPAKGDAS